MVLFAVTANAYDILRVATYGSFGGASPKATFQESGNVMAGPSMQHSAVGRNRALDDDYLL